MDANNFNDWLGRKTKALLFIAYLTVLSHIFSFISNKKK